MFVLGNGFVRVKGKNISSLTLIEDPFPSTRKGYCSVGRERGLVITQTSRVTDGDYT